MMDESKGKQFDVAGKVEDRVSFQDILFGLIIEYYNGYFRFKDTYQDVDSHDRIILYEQWQTRADAVVQVAEIFNVVYGGDLEERLAQLLAERKEGGNSLKVRGDWLQASYAVALEYLQGLGTLIEIKRRRIIDADWPVSDTP